MAEKFTFGLESEAADATVKLIQIDTLGIRVTAANLAAVAAAMALAAAETAMAAAEDELALAEAAEAAALAALAGGAETPAGLLRALPLPFGSIIPEPPEIALPTLSGSGPDVEGDTETVEMFAALTEMSGIQKEMGDAVFATLDPILQGLEGDLTYAVADTAIFAAGITDEPHDTRPPLPVSEVVPSMARMQLFDEFVYALRRATMAAGTEDPEAPGKILCAYMALAVEKFVRRAVIRVSLPDDKIISLTADLNTFGTNTAAKSAENITLLGNPSLTECDYNGTSGDLGSYDLQSADMLLGFNIVPQLTFYGGIDTLKDYGYNFDAGNSDPLYRAEGGEVPLVNLQAILMGLKNGINFI